MIRLAFPEDSLDPAERFGLAALLDASRLLPLLDSDADVVTLALDVEPALQTALAAPPSPADAFPRADGQVRVGRRTLRWITTIAGAGTEQTSPLADRYERVPAEANPLVRAGVERAPVITLLGRGLREAVVAVAGRRPVRVLAPWPDGRRWAAALTHDLDIAAGWPAFTALRAVELMCGGNARRAARVLASAAASWRRDVVRDGVDEVLRADGAHGVRATWFVICGSPTLSTWRRGDITYLPESRRVRSILGQVAHQGHEIGLHGSFATMLDAARFAAERRRLEVLVERPVEGVRQHFLRFRPGRTQRVMAEAGFRYDASYGFSSRNGFRLGAADAVVAWDAAAHEPLDLQEVPLIWMDRALSKYRGVEDPDAWVDDALALAAACRAVDGLWVGLWHPNLTPPLGFPGAPEAYARLLGALVAERPHLDSLGALARWRSARRTARGEHLLPDGNVQMAGGAGNSLRLALEDAGGRVVQTAGPL